MAGEAILPPGTNPASEVAIGYAREAWGRSHHPNARRLLLQRVVAPLHRNRMIPAPLRCTTLIGCLIVATAARGGAQQQAIPPDAILLSLPALVTAALSNNLELRSASIGPRLALADLLAQRSLFDPSVTLSAERGDNAHDVLSVSPRTTTSAFRNTAALGALFPVGTSLGLSVSGSRLSTDPFALSSTQPFPTSHASSMAVTLTQPLLRGAGRAGSYGLVDAAAASVDAARDRYERNADLLVALVERGYWTLRQAESNELVARQSVDAGRAIYDRNVALQQRDVATALDVLTSERGLATRETQLMDATRQRADAADRLLFLVYGDDARGARLAQASRMHTAPDSVIVPTVPNMADAESEALAQRSDALAVARDVDAGRKRVALTKNQLRPQLDVIASYGYGGTAPGTRLLNYRDSADVRTSNWSLGLSASLFQRNDAASALDQRAEASLDLARLAASATENVVRSDVRTAVRALQTARDRYLRAVDVIRLAEAEYAAAREGARLGLITTFQLLQYEDQVAQSRLLFAQARFAVEDAGSQYRLAVGGGRKAYAARR